MSVLFLKLGGSAITDKTRAATPKLDVIRDAARAIKSAREQNPKLKILLGHGSGSFGHFTAKKFGFGSGGDGGGITPDASSRILPIMRGLRDDASPPLQRWRAYAETGASAARLNRLVTDIFLEENVPAVSLQPSASARTRNGELYTLDVANIRTALDHDLIPLIYGDVAFDDVRGMAIVSTDAQFAYLAPILKPSRIIYTTAVNGIYTADPNKNPDAQLIREITPASFEKIRAHVGEAQGFDVTGGMLDKVARSVALVEKFPALEIFVVSAQALVLEKTILTERPIAGTRIAQRTEERTW